jgi:hypothetical protein
MVDIGVCEDCREWWAVAEGEKGRELICRGCFAVLKRGVAWVEWAIITTASRTLSRDD